MYVGTGKDVPYDGIDVNDNDYVLLREKRVNDTSAGNY